MYKQVGIYIHALLYKEKVSMELCAVSIQKISSKIHSSSTASPPGKIPGWGAWNPALCEDGAW